MKKKQPAGTTLATFGRRQRTALVCELVEIMLDVDSLGFGDALNNDDTMRVLAARLDVPVMALHQLVDGRVTAEDMREWCAFSREAVA